MNQFELDEDILHVENVMFRKWSAAAALSLLLYEYAVTCSDEFRHIWKRKNFNSVLGVYLFCRYFTITIQTINLILVIEFLSHPGDPIHHCKGWYSFQLISACIILAALDYILMLRVYAMYNKNLKIGLLLVFLFVVMLVADFQCGSRVIDTLTYDSICNGKKVHPCVPFYGMTLWSVHLTLGILIAVKKWRLLALNSPIVNIVTRDGALVLIGICASATEIMREAMSMKALKVELTFMWPISLLSIACCRIIMQLRTLDRGYSSFEEDRSLTIFTSEIDLICLEQDQLSSD